MSIKKVFAASLAVMSLTGAFAVNTAGAQSTVDLQAQIAALLAQIAQLQSQLGGSNTGGGSSSVSCTFTRSLTVGSNGADVKCLQDALIAGGYLAAGNNTGYFGGLTKAAVVKWQTAAGVSPASGLFGPLSRAKFASMSSGGGTGGNTGNVPASGLAVSLASDSPSGSAISGAGQVVVGKFRLTASNAAGVTVTGMTFRKQGVLSDSSINNLYLADESGMVVAQYNSLSSGVATFSGLNLSVNAGQTRTFSLRMDLASGLSAGNSIGWSLETVAAGSASVSGTPVMGNNLVITTVSNPSLATAAWDFNSVGSTVDAGTNNVQIGSASVNVGNSAAYLRNVKFTLVGSANMADVRNLKLMVNGAQVGSTVSSVSSDGTVSFDLNSANARLNTGNSTVDLYADVMGSPNRNFTVRVLRPYDVSLVDTQYNTGISPTVTDDSNAITINQGQITVSLASDSPTGNIPKGASNVNLAKFTIFASGEPVKVKFLDLTITKSGGATWATLANVNSAIANISLVDDAGNQVGSTISTVTEGTSNGQCSLTSATVTTCHLGTSGSPINYIVPANTTRVLTAKVDVKTTNDVTSLRAGLAAGTNNLEGQTSFQQTSSGAANGAALTVVNNPLSVSANGSFAAPTYVAGANNQRIASFVFTASSAEGAKINTLTFDKDTNTNMDLQNMKVMVGSTQFGTTRPTIGDTESGLAFSGSPIVVPAGGSVTVDVYADILSTTAAGSQTTVIDFVSWTAVGSVSNSSIASPAAVNGQSITISTGPTLTISKDETNSPSARQIVMNTSDNTLFAARFTASNVEDVKVTDIAILDTVSGTTAAGQTSFSNVSLWDGSSRVGGILTPTMAGSATSTVTFSFSEPVVIPKNGSKTLVLKGTVSDYSSGAVSGSVHTWSVLSTSTVTAFGKDSNQSVEVDGSAAGNAQSVYRSKLSMTSSVLGSTSGRARQAVDDLATVSWTANSGNQVVLSTVTVKFSGQAVSDGSTAFTVDLLKSDGSALGGATQQTCTPGAGNSCSVTFSPAFTISAGATQASKVRVNSGSFFDAASANESLSVLVNAAGDVLWSDGSTSGITLESSVVPFTIASVQY